MKKGFTLIELMIVIAIISIIAGIAIPNLLRARLSSNESSAISSLRTIVSAQAMYEQSHDEYGSLSDLSGSDEELIDDVLGTGKESGYEYKIEDQSPDGWIGRSTPSSPLSAVHHHYVNQDGRIYRGLCGNGLLEPGEQCDMGSSETSGLCGLGFRCHRTCVCLSVAPGNVDEQINPLTGPVSFLARREAAIAELDFAGQDLIAALLSLAPGTTTAPAIELLQSPRTVRKILKLLDADGDKKLSLEEMANADVAGIASRIARKLEGPASDLQVDGGLVDQLVQSYQQFLEYKILPGMTEDEELPLQPIKELRPQVNADLLKMFPPDLVDHQQVN